MQTNTETEITNYIQSLNWRYATKKFDADRKLSGEELEDLVNAIRLSASSYGLQPYRVLVISDPEVRKALRPACWDQSQVTDASHLLVFTHQTDFGPELVDSYIDTVAETRGMEKEKLSGYADFMKSKLVDLPASAKANWTARQVYLAVGNLLSAAAAARIDACPMEGFEAEKVNDILGLAPKGLSAAVLVAVGHRSPEDATQHKAKVRRPYEEIFTHI